MNRPTNPAQQTGRNRAFFASKTQDELLEIARSYDLGRRTRAAQELGDYRLNNSEGQILKLSTGEAYECEDLRRWCSDENEEVAFFGCDCPDEQYRLQPLREAMQAARCGTPCFCKHHYQRQLLSGYTLTVGDFRIRAKVPADK